ncbi:MAG: winged helix-turn-helix domain-containing protein, partial [Bdellovibrionales bacterium]|nr:winged helix-turn-helix domain-containing protein [Bdellovibrionales bacterium]
YETLKDRKQLYTYLCLLLQMGNTYADMGELDLARMYLNLVKKSLDPANHKRVARILDKRLLELGAESGTQYDLVFDLANNSILEKKKGRVDFHNQFILLDLLRLFLRHPGEVYSKESLVRKIWKQEYDPSIHDNKIYVTIKRLRKMIEPDYDKPKYIFRAKNGYYLNRNTRILFEQ